MGSGLMNGDDNVSSSIAFLYSSKKHSSKVANVSSWERYCVPVHSYKIHCLETPQYRS